MTSICLWGTQLSFWLWSLEHWAVASDDLGILLWWVDSYGSRTWLDITSKVIMDKEVGSMGRLTLHCAWVFGKGTWGHIWWHYDTENEHHNGRGWCWQMFLHHFHHWMERLHSVCGKTSKLAEVHQEELDGKWGSYRMKERTPTPQISAGTPTRSFCTFSGAGRSKKLHPDHRISFQS